MGVQEMKQIALWISQVLKNPESLEIKSRVQSQVAELCQGFPIYPA